MKYHFTRVLSAIARAATTERPGIPADGMLQ